MRCSLDMRILFQALALSLLLLSVAAHKKSPKSNHSRVKMKQPSNRTPTASARSLKAYPVKAHTNSKLLKRDSGHVVAIASEGEFYVELAIGTPPQRFLVQPDTGSPDTWLPTVDCTSCSSFKRLFNYTASSTSSHQGASRNDFTIVYDDNDSVRGSWVRETLTIGAGPLRSKAALNRKLKIPRAVLGLIRWESGSWLEQKVDGVLGLSMGSPILRNILDVTSNGIGAYRFFTVRYNSLMGTSSYEFSSRLDLPTAKAASYLPVIPNEQNDWIVNLSMSFATLPGHMRQHAGIIDTGTNLLALPSASANEMVKALTLAITGETEAVYTQSQVAGGAEFSVPCPQGRGSKAKSIMDKTIARLYLGKGLTLPIRVRDLVSDTERNYWTEAELDAQYADGDDTWSESEDEQDTQDQNAEEEEVLDEILPYRPRHRKRRLNRHQRVKRDTRTQQYCIALLDVVPDGEPAIIGDVVLKRLVTVFHESKKRVGFALNRLE